MRASLFAASVTTSVMSLVLAALPNASLAQDSVKSFYAGRTVNVVIGYPPGGGFDSSARLLMRHMPRHIPGAPTMVPKNMPGAGSLVAANYGSSE